MLRADLLLEQVREARYLSSLDFIKGYWQVPMWPCHCEKTAFAMPQGLFHFAIMSFGLPSAAAAFQLLVDYVLGSCQSYYVAYLDDILLFSRTWEELSGSI